MATQYPMLVWDSGVGKHRPVTSADALDTASAQAVTAAVVAAGMVSAARGWAAVNGANGATLASYGIASVVRNSIGSFTVTLASAMNNIVPIVTVQQNGGPEITVSVTSATTFNIGVTSRTTGGNADPTRLFIVVYGN